MPQRVSGDELLTDFKAICLDWDGALDLAEEAALGLGYVSAPELAPENLYQGGGLYIYVRRADGVEWRTVLKRHSIMTADGTGRFIRCSVSASPADVSSTRRAVGRHTGLRSFAQLDTAVFAWTWDENNRRQPVTRPAFEGSLVPLLNSRGMRAILVARHDDQVILTLMTPTDDPR